MTSSEPDSPQTDKELLAAGWQRCFIYDEPRLSEAIAAYREMGHEVMLRRVSASDAECTECMLAEPDRFKVIYTRRRAEGDLDDELYE